MVKLLRNFLKNPCNLYFLLWVTYSLQGVVYARGSVISQCFLLLIMLVSLKEVLSFVYNRDSFGYFQSLNLLVAMFTIYGLILFLTDGLIVHGVGGRRVQSFNYLKVAYMSLLPIYVVYIYSRKGFLTLPLLQYWMFVFLLVGIIDYNNAQEEALKKLMLAGSSKTEITNNAGYVLLSLIPGMMVYNKKPLLFYLGMAICVAFVLMGMKRGAILICAVSLLLIVWYKLRTAKGVYKITVFFAICVSFVILYNFVEHLLENSDYFNARIEATMEGNSSHRDDLYMTFINAFTTKASFLQMIFGRGACGTIKYSYNYAHNDWLEILTNQGVMGIFIFMYYWYSFYREIKSSKYSEESSFCLFLLFCMFGLKTMFSMSICSMPIYTTTMLGFCLANGFETKQYDDNEKNSVDY